jgi:hypothetical protein
MKDKTPNANTGVCCKGNEEDGVMTLFETVRDAFQPQIDKTEIRNGVDDLGGINRSVIVLPKII